MSANPIVSGRIKDIEQDIKQVSQELERLEELIDAGMEEDDATIERIHECEIYLEKLSDELWTLNQNR